MAPPKEITLEDFESAWTNWKDQSAKERAVYRDADLIFTMIEKDPSLAKFIVEIYFKRPAEFEEILPFPYLQRAFAPSITLPLPGQVPSRDFDKLYIDYTDPEDTANWLLLKNIHFDIHFREGLKTIISIRHRGPQIVVIGHRDLMTTYNVLKEWYDLEYPVGLESVGWSEWTFEGNGDLLMLSIEFPNGYTVELLESLGNYQEALELDVVSVMKMYTKDQAIAELPIYARDLSVIPMEFDFFPSDVNTERRKGFLAWSCQSTEKRIRHLYPALQNLFVGKWERRSDLIAASEGSPNIFSLAFKYGPEACYSSGLVKTRMTNLRNIENVYVGDGELLLSKEGVPETSEEVLYVPVIRYSSGPTGTLFFKGKSNEKEYCGTFYYYEPESEVVLRTESLISSRNKYTLALTFRNMLPEEALEDVITQSAMDRVLSIFRQKLMEYSMLVGGNDRNVDEVLDLLAGRIEWSPFLQISSNFENELGKYRNVFYALEDVFDQPLCKAGRELGYDLIVLTDMAGSSRLVTEVLDTRSRQESLENLYTVE